jgi:transposase
MAHIVGVSRDQVVMFAPTLDEAVPGDSVVRVIDSFVDSMNLAALGFRRVVSAEFGRPPYPPGSLLKLYLYGYLNQIRSSRRLECEAERNIELRWLLQMLMPSFKTIADFRRDHPEAIVGVTQAFISFCRSQSLVGGKVLAIDGTKIEAVASHKKALTPQNLEKKAARMDHKIREYLKMLDEADRETPLPEVMAKSEVEAALEALRTRRDEVRRQAERLASKKLSQEVVGEPEAKLMRTARHGYQVAYNAQSVVDAEHKLVVAFDLTNEGNDQRQLLPMALKGKEAVGAEQVTVVADPGYSNGEHGELCAKAGITAIVPRAATVNPEGKEFFSREAFSYDRASDTWRCPANQTLSLSYVSKSERRYRYTTEACASCALKPRCTKGAQRTILRDFHEDAREAMHQRSLSDPSWMEQRRCLAEHPFGGIKHLMGRARFLVRGLRKAKAELGLIVVAYNLKRVINILGAAALIHRFQRAAA